MVTYLPCEHPPRPLPDIVGLAGVMALKCDGLPKTAHDGMGKPVQPLTECPPHFERDRYTDFGFVRLQSAHKIWLPPLFEDLSDVELLNQCRSGHQAAWSTLVRRFQRIVYTVPCRAGLAPEAADDVFQSTFSRLVKHLDRIEDGSRIRAWLVTTAKRETLDALAAIKRTAAHIQPTVGDDDDLLGQMPDLQPLPEALLSELQQHDRVRTAVDQLDPRSRQFVELAFLQEEPVPYSEIARRLGIPEGSIGPTRARCLAKLRAILGKS